MVRVKICGITNLEDALTAIRAGADALGFVFAQSPRRVSPETARAIVRELPPLVSKVGVFVDSEVREVQDILSFCNLDLAQLHGQEPPEYCQVLFPRVIKAFQIRDEASLADLAPYAVRAFLLDSYSPERAGGTGMPFHWELARKAAAYGPVILAGGLTPENVRQAIAVVRPYAVDVSSGVETSPGHKDPSKVGAFLRAVKSLGEESNVTR